MAFLHATKGLNTINSSVTTAVCWFLLVLFVCLFVVVFVLFLLVVVVTLLLLFLFVGWLVN